MFEMMCDVVKSNDIEAPVCERQRVCSAQADVETEIPMFRDETLVNFNSNALGAAGERCSLQQLCLATADVEERSW